MINGFRIIEDLGRIKGHTYLIVICPLCHTKVKKRKDCLKHYKSCGCKHNNFLAPKRLRQIFIKMKYRCYHIKDPAYKNYGARGIKIYQQWLDNQILFYEWAFKNGYNKSLTIDRINNDEGYFPENCRWVTKKQQSRNTRKTVNEEIVRRIRAESSFINLKELAAKYGIGYSCLKAIRSYQNWKDV